jgi:type IV pilus assembly protein PilM
MEPKELDEAVQWELDRQTPFPVDQVIYDFQPVDHPGIGPESENMEVLLAVAQEDMVNAHAETVLSAKLTPVAIDVEPLALGRSLIEMGDESLLASTVVLVNIGHTSSLIAIFCQGEPVFIRSIPTAGESFTTAVRQAMQLPEPEAERAKKQFADMAYVEGLEEAYGEYEEEEDMLDHATDSVFELSDSELAEGIAEEADDVDEMATRLDVDAQAYELPPEPGAAPADQTDAKQEPLPEEVAWAKEHVSDALVDPLSELATEIRRSVQHYQRQHRQEQISKLLVSGGSATIPGLASFLEAEIGISAEVADPFKHVETDPDNASAPYLKDVGPTLAIAVGLALRDMVDRLDAHRFSR